jgi:hypothetical protein
MKHIIGAILTLGLQTFVIAQNEDGSLPSKAVIYYSAAPWDAPAYEILVPMRVTSQSAKPYIMINIWGNPEFRNGRRLTFSREGRSNEAGRASFQSILNKSMPVQLSGTISFKTLQKNGPVSGIFEFVSEQGEKFKAEFEATWGNEPLRYIR